MSWLIKNLFEYYIWNPLVYNYSKFNISLMLFYWCWNHPWGKEFLATSNIFFIGLTFWVVMVVIYASGSPLQLGHWPPLLAAIGAIGALGSTYLPFWSKFLSFSVSSLVTFSFVSHAYLSDPPSIPLHLNLFVAACGDTEPVYIFVK